MQFQGYLLLGIAFINFVLGTSVLVRNVRMRTNITFAIFTYSVALWALGLGGFILTHTTYIELIWAQQFYISAAAIAPTFVLFVTDFTQSARRTSLKRTVLVLLPFLYELVVIVFVPDLLIAGITYKDLGNKSVELVGITYAGYGLIFISYAVYGFYIIIKALNRTKGVPKLQLKYIFYGLLVAFSLGATFNLFLPAAGNYNYVWVGPLFTVAYIGMVTYSIVRHRLFDIRLIIAKSLAYVSLLVTLGVIFAFGIFAITGLFFGETSIPVGLRVTYVALAVVIAFALGPLKRFFDKLTNAIFYQDAYDPEALLDELNKVLVSTYQLSSLLSQTSKLLRQNLKMEYCFFAIREKDGVLRKFDSARGETLKQHDLQSVDSLIEMRYGQVIVTDTMDDEGELRGELQRNNIAVLVNLVASNTAGEKIGYFALGGKKSGNPYNRQDIRIIEIIANELVIAIQNALHFEEIENFNKTLQQKVEDATRELRKTNEKLKALDEAKDEFISMASHQLRTPLTSVKGYISMVLEGDVGKVSQQQRKLLDQAFISSQRMVYLIADLLNVSRLRTGKFVIEPVSTNLADSVQEEVGQLTETAAGRGLTLTYDRPKDFPTLMLDETKIRQVVMNFTDNAIYYTPSGGHIVAKLEDLGESIQFTVSDDGIGVPKHEQHHLFSKFYRAGNAKKARPDGTGLGLFMAKKVIIAQGGSIVFNSQEGKGSTFGFAFSKSKLQAQNSKT